MRNLLTGSILVLSIMTASVALAQTSGFMHVYTPIDDVSPAVNGGTSTHFDESDWGISSFILAAGGWAEGYFGPTFAPIAELELGLSAGLQQGDDGAEPRFAFSVWTGVGDFSMFSVLEFDLNGVDGLWFDLTPKFRVLDWLQIGVKARRFVGTGPFVSIDLPEIPVSTWVSWQPWDPEEASDFTAESGLMGVTVGF